MTIWFFSDPHFGHARILGDGEKSRKFATVEAMDAHIIERINQRVKVTDHLYCLGDVAIDKRAVECVTPLLQGHKRLILGNHDIETVDFYRKCGWQKLMAYRVFNDILFSHMPVAPWSAARYRANVHGHCHMSQPLVYDYEAGADRARYVNLSVERTNYTPVTLEQIEKWL